MATLFGPPLCITQQCHSFSKGQALCSRKMGFKSEGEIPCPVSSFSADAEPMRESRATMFRLSIGSSMLRLGESWLGGPCRVSPRRVSVSVPCRRHPEAIDLGRLLLALFKKGKWQEFKNCERWQLSGSLTCGEGRLLGWCAKQCFTTGRPRIWTRQAR